MKKIVQGIRALILFLSVKIRYGSHVKLHFLNSIYGKVTVDLKDDSLLKIGKFLMTQGPLYLKALKKSQIIIGYQVFFNHNCSVTAIKKVQIGNNVDIANNVVIVDHDHVVDKKGVHKSLVSAPVIIDDNVWIGANVVITKGVHIGEGAVIASGAVVIQDVPSHTLAAGIPAKKVKTYE